jgi:Na+/H+ antiporter NhaD/arsenite permease-like protein
MRLPAPAPIAALVAGLFAAAPALAAAQGHETGLAATRDPVSQGIVAVIIVLVFAVLARETAHRVLVIFGSVSLLWLITYLTPYHLLPFEAAHRSLDLNVILLLAAMMAVVGVLKQTGVFDWAVGRLLDRSGGQPVTLLVLIVWFTAVLSSMMDNVTTVIFVTPMALEIARRAAIPPTALILPMVMASNIGGTATLIGDPPNILIGSGAGLSFLDFLKNLTVPVLWMVVASVAFSRRYFRRELAGARPTGFRGDAPRIHQPVLLKWSLVISGFIFLGFLTHTLTGMPAAVPAAIGAAAILIVQDAIYLRTNRPSAAERLHGILYVIEKEIEWPTLAFFAFLFMTVGAAVETGLIDTMAGGLSSFIHWGSATFALSPTGTLLFACMMILWVSGVLSGLIDNIPFVAVAIPIIARLTGELTGDVEALWWALSLGACLGGNGTPIGASANVTVTGLAERAGTHVTFGEFLRFGASTAAVTLLIASVFLGAHLYLGMWPTFIGGGAGVAVVILFQVMRGMRRGTVTVTSEQ